MQLAPGLLAGLRVGFGVGKSQSHSADFVLLEVIDFTKKIT